MQDKNRFVWLGVIGVTLLMALYHVFGAGQALYTYSKLNQTVPVQFSSWQVEQLGWGRFAARVSFEWEGEDRQELLLSVGARNSWSVDELMEPLMSKPWEAWTNEEKSVVRLERNYPWREVIYALVLCGLLLYFCGLKLYLKKLNGGSPKV